MALKEIFDNKGNDADQIRALSALRVTPADDQTRALSALRVTPADDQMAMLESILNGMEALITVMDPDTFNILFINDSIRRHFGIETSGIGQKCHKVLQKLDEPCPTCPYRKLKDEPDLVLVWEHHEVVRGSILRKTAKMIGWPGGKRAHLEYAVDITAERKAQEALKRSEEQLQQQNRLLYAVNRVSAILIQATANTFDKELLRSLGIIAEAANVDRIYIWKNRTIKGELHFGQIIEWSRSKVVDRDESLVTGVSYQDALPGWKDAFLKRKCVNARVCDMPEVERDFLADYGLTSVLAVPIFLKKQFWGFISFACLQFEQVFSQNEEEILRSVSELIANALLRNRMEKNILQLEGEVDKIYYDSLTEIYNRRFFDVTIRRVISTLTRSGSELSLMMIDIDNFKLYNDTYGHLMGDDCLKTVAKALKDSVSRSEDFVARYGGEEFVVVLPNTTENGARMLAKRVLENVRACNIPHEESSTADCVTVSVGVAVGKAENALGSEDYIQHADSMLYESKRSGRNKYSLIKIN